MNGVHASSWQAESGFFFTTVKYKCGGCGTANSIRGRDLWNGKDDIAYHPCQFCSTNNFFRNKEGKYLIRS